MRDAPARAEGRVGRPRLSSATAELSQLLRGGCQPHRMLPHRTACCHTRTTCLHPGRSIAPEVGGTRPRTKTRRGGCGRRCRSDRSATCDTDHAACDMQHARGACKIRASRKRESKLCAAVRRKVRPGRANVCELNQPRATVSDWTMPRLGNPRHRTMPIFGNPRQPPRRSDCAALPDVIRPYRHELHSELNLFLFLFL
jgi:hypothetical protein